MVQSALGDHRVGVLMGRLARTFRQLWPPGNDGELTKADLSAWYAPPVDPWLRVNFVAGVDGAATVDGASEPLSGPADKAVFAILRDHCDALIVGAETFRRERYRLPVAGPARQLRRVSWGRAAQPRLVVVSGSLNLDLSSAAGASPETAPLVITHAGSDPTRRAALGNLAEVACIGEQTVDLPSVIAELHRRGYTQLLCEGGPRLFAQLATAGLVDELCLTLSPQLALGDGPRIATGNSEQTQPVPLRLTALLHADGMLLSRYSVDKDATV
ncbi:MAG: pyrimidine reductase family protein [Mycobacteriales bacterium]